MVSEHSCWESWENLQKHFSATSKASLEKVLETLQRISWLQLNPASVAQAGHSSSALLFHKKWQRVWGRGLGQDRSVSSRSQWCWSPAPGPTTLKSPLIRLFSWNWAMNELVGLMWYTMVPACICLNIDVSQKTGILDAWVGWYNMETDVLRITQGYHVPAQLSVPSHCKPCKVLILPWGYNRFFSCWRASLRFVSYEPIQRSCEVCGWSHAHNGWLFLGGDNLWVNAMLLFLVKCQR